MSKIVAVYGTLRKGGRLYSHYMSLAKQVIDYPELEKGTSEGTFLLPGYDMYGLVYNFPIVFPSEDPNNKIVIELYEVNKNLYNALVNLEPDFLYKEKRHDTGFIMFEGKSTRLKTLIETDAIHAYIESGDYIEYAEDYRRFTV